MNILIYFNIYFKDELLIKTSFNTKLVTYIFLVLINHCQIINELDTSAFFNYK